MFPLDPVRLASVLPPLAGDGAVRQKHARVLKDKMLFRIECVNYIEITISWAQIGIMSSRSNYIRIIISSTLTSLDPTMVHFSEPRISLASNLEVSRVERPPREPRRTAAKEKRSILRSSMPAGGQPGSY